MNTHQVAVVMGSDSDWETMQGAVDQLKDFGISVHVEVLSAHRTPQQMLDFATSAANTGFKVIIAGAGGAAHLPGMIASATSLPVIGVPVSLNHLEGLDSLLSIVQMPTGVPVATVAIGNSKNAALLALRKLATNDPKLQTALDEYREKLEVTVAEKSEALRNRINNN